MFRLYYYYNKNYKNYIGYIEIKPNGTKFFYIYQLYLGTAVSTRRHQIKRY